MTSVVPAAVFDPLDEEFLRDPYPLYARLRGEPAPLLPNGPGQFVAARHLPVAALLKDPRLGNEYPPMIQQMKLGAGDACDFVLRSALHLEGDEHAVLRRFLGRVVYAQPAEAMRERIGHLVDQLLEPALQRGELDAVADLAVPLPLAVACDLVGIPEPDRPTVSRAGLTVIKAFALRLEQAEQPEVDAAVRELRSYFADRVDSTLLAPQLGAALAELPGGRLDRSTLIDNVLFLFVSGFTTTVHLIANGCAALLAYPDQLARLRAQPSLIETAVEEFLRYDTPIQHVSRLVRQRIDVDGVTLRPGRLVHLLLGAANRDPATFADPDRFDVGRHPNPHVAFGGGGHFCLGANLGRLETSVLMERLIARCAVFEAAGDAVRRPAQVFRTHGRVPARVSPK